MSSRVTAWRPVRDTSRCRRRSCFRRRGLRAASTIEDHLFEVTVWARWSDGKLRSPAPSRARSASGCIRTTPGRRCRFAEDPLTHDGEAAARIAGTARPPCPLLDHVLVTVEPGADRPPVVRRSDTGLGHGMVERVSPHPRGDRRAPFDRRSVAMRHLRVAGPDTKRSTDPGAPWTRCR